MAYMSQERKAVIAAALKKVVPAGWKYTLSVQHHSGIVFTLRQAPVDLLGHIAKVQDEIGTTAHLDKMRGHYQVNEYYLDTQFSGDILKVFQDIKAAMNEGNHDNSDAMTDYFDVGWYTYINIGKLNDPFLDTVPAPYQTKQEKKYLKAQTATAKPAYYEYAPYLPDDWKNLSPGRKAAATKKAMAQVMGVIA